MAPELLTVIVTSVSCVAFCLVMLMFAVALYRMDLCCRFRTEHDADEFLNCHSRRSTLGCGFNDPSGAVNQTAAEPQFPGRLYIIGKPNDYHLSEVLPRLPSYDSVCKNERHRMMISSRFGLSSSCDGAPPTYEEAIHQSDDVSSVHLHSLDVNLSVPTQDDSLYLYQEAHNGSLSASGHHRPPSDHPAPSCSFMSI